MDDGKSPGNNKYVFIPEKTVSPCKNIPSWIITEFRLLLSKRDATNSTSSWRHGVMQDRFRKYENTQTALLMLNKDIRGGERNKLANLFP